MTAIHHLAPGDLVTNVGDSATFITHTEHPIWPQLRLVIWRMADGSWSHDALSINQDVGQVEPATPAKRQERLRAALLGEGAR